MDDVQWVMASSAAEATDGAGSTVRLDIYQGDGLPRLAGPWRWAVNNAGCSDTLAFGRGYLSPGDARAAAEAWLATYRAHNEAKAKEGEGES